MKNMIEELYYGNIDPQGYSCRPNSPVKRASDAGTDPEEELLKSPDGEDRDLFLRFCNAYSEFLGESELETFITGFHLGARITMDTLFEWCHSD